MEPPRVEYAKTSDDLSIAYVDVGAGHPIVFVPTVPFAQLQTSWDVLEHHPLADGYRRVAYDPRGSGLSDGGPKADYSVLAMLRDLEAVVARAGIDQFAAYARQTGAPIMLAAAAEWPERITHLLSVDGWACYSFSSHGKLSGRALAERTVALHRHMQTLAKAAAGPGDASWTDFASTLRSKEGSADPMRAQNEALVYDVRSLLHAIRSPALIIHTVGWPWLPPEAGPDLAASISKAKLILTEDSDGAQLPDLLATFIGKDPEAAKSEVVGLGASPHTLTRREREVLALIAQHKTNGQIAEALTIAPATASRHVHNILEKLGMSRRSEAAVWWSANGHANE